MTVRSFSNSDLPQLARLWNEHWSALGADPMISVARFEQAILAKTFFDPNALLVWDSGTIDGWCLTYRHPDIATTAMVVSLCLSGNADISVGLQLLHAIDTQVASDGVQQICVGTVRDTRFGLAGLSPIGHGIGIPKHDVRICSLLSECGYAEQQTVQRLTASVGDYRPPINRDAMQMRRSTQVRVIDYSPPSVRYAAAMSHLDIETRCLVDRSENELARLNVWFSDPEAEVMNPTSAIFDLTALESDDRLSAAEGYLIGTTVQSLGERGIATVETAIDLGHQTLLEQMQILRFEASDSGIGWVKQASVA